MLISENSTRSTSRNCLARKVSGKCLFFMEIICDIFEYFYVYKLDIVPPIKYSFFVNVSNIQSQFFFVSSQLFNIKDGG